MEVTDVQVWLQTQIAEEAGIAVNEVSCDEDFENFNLDSLSLVSISFELESRVDLEISPSVFTEFNTINKLAEWVSNQK